MTKMEPGLRLRVLMNLDSWIPFEKVNLFHAVTSRKSMVAALSLQNLSERWGKAR